MLRRSVASVLIALAGAGCAAGRAPTPSTGAATSTSLAATTTTTPSTTASPTSATATAVPARGGLTAADLPASWRPGCPVPPSDLRALRIDYHDFDGVSRTGTLVVHARVADAVTRVFARLYREGFPIRRLEPVDAYGGDDERSLEADNTAGFNCRRAVSSGPPRWSAHAYGTAIDVNPVENPYLEGGRVHPASGAAFVDRSEVRPGMAVAGGVLVDAFASVGWQWGGRWASTPDYQHFSSSGG